MLSGAAQMRALLVDDDPIALAVLEAHLNELGIRETVACHDGAEALSVLNENGAIAFDVAFLDLFMPNLDGVEFLRTVANHPVSPPIVVVSSATRAVVEPALTLARAQGCDVLGYARKPVTRDALKQALTPSHTGTSSYCDRRGQPRAVGGVG